MGGKDIRVAEYAIENRSTNTEKNIQFTKDILKKLNLNFKSFIIVHVTSPNISLADYPNDFISKDDLINIMVGDLQRIKIYPDKGFQIYQEIPENIWDAYNILVNTGFDKRLIKD